MLVLYSCFFSFFNNAARAYYYPHFRSEKTEVLGLPVSGKKTLLAPNPKLIPFYCPPLSPGSTCHQGSRLPAFSVLPQLCGSCRVPSLEPLSTRHLSGSHWELLTRRLTQLCLPTTHTFVLTWPLIILGTAQAGLQWRVH